MLWRSSWLETNRYMYYWLHSIRTHTSGSVDPIFSVEFWYMLCRHIPKQTLFLLQIPRCSFSSLPIALAMDGSGDRVTTSRQIALLREDFQIICCVYSKKFYRTTCVLVRKRSQLENWKVHFPWKQSCSWFRSRPTCFSGIFFLNHDQVLLNLDSIQVFEPLRRTERRLFPSIVICTLSTRLHIIVKTVLTPSLIASVAIKVRQIPCDTIVAPSLAFLIILSFCR